MDITLLVASTATSIDDGWWRVGKKKKMQHSDRNMGLGTGPTTIRGIMMI